MKKPQPIRSELYERSSCTFFDDLHTMMISLSSLMMISQVFRLKRSPIIDIDDPIKLERAIEVPFEGQTIKEAWSFRAYESFMAMVENRATDIVEFTVYPPLETSIRDIANLHYIIQSVLFQQKIIGSGFSNYFENNRHKIESKYGSNTTSWPADWNFSRVIRNAYSHGGNINFSNPSALPVSWKSITYSPSDNGKSIHEDIFLPEILELLRDMQNHL